jgi:hypothetical protein
MGIAIVFEREQLDLDVPVFGMHRRDFPQRHGRMARDNVTRVPKKRQEKKGDVAA